ATAPTVNPAVSRRRTKAPAPVSEAANVPVTVFATSHRSTLPLATTARFAAVIAPAPPAIWVTAAPELSRTVAVLPAPVLIACVSVIGPAILTRSTSPLLVVTPALHDALPISATAPTVNPAVSRRRTKAPAPVSEAANVPVTVFATSHRSTL